MHLPVSAATELVEQMPTVIRSVEEKDLQDSLEECWKTQARWREQQKQVAEYHKKLDAEIGKAKEDQVRLQKYQEAHIDFNIQVLLLLCRLRKQVWLTKLNLLQIREKALKDNLEVLTNHGESFGR